MNLSEIVLLYIEDEEPLRDVIGDFLKDKVKELHIATNGSEGYEIYSQVKPHIILSDINMPKLNGIDLITKIRSSDQNVRVIMLTAHSEIDKLLRATELKLTKYLLKPSGVDEIYKTLLVALSEVNSFTIISNTKIDLADGYWWDCDNRSLHLGGDEIRLTPKEKKILAFLFANTGKTISYDMLIENIWDDYDTYSIDGLKTMVKNIRKKLPLPIIHNVYGIGFKLSIANTPHL